VSWWVPFAFIGAAVVGIAIAFSLTAGRPRAGAADHGAQHQAHGERPRSRYEQDNALLWNPSAFVAVAASVGLLVLIAVLIEVL
jgi:hypothetical protein